MAFIGCDDINNIDVEAQIAILVLNVYLIYQTLILRLASLTSCRGEKSFCSLGCRAFEIMIDEELEKSNEPPENSIELESGEEHFGSGIFTAA